MRLFKNVLLVRTLRRQALFRKQIKTLTSSKPRQLIKSHVTCSYCTAVQSEDEHGVQPKQWTSKLVLQEPEYDTSYLLDPANYKTIKENIENRKGVGNIDLVVDLWKKLCNENNPEMKETIRLAFLEAVGDIPNQSHPDSPTGDEENARQVELVGAPRNFDFDPQSCVELGERLGMLRTSKLQQITGHGTYFLLDKIAMLEQALVKYTVDFLRKRGFEMISVPDLLDPQVIEGCGFKTRGDVAQVYKLDPTRHKDLCLAGTSEMPLAGYFINEVLKEEDLPKKYVQCVAGKKRVVKGNNLTLHRKIRGNVSGFIKEKVAAVSRCYRAEVSKLEEESGIYRVHQFTKVEMFGVTSNDTGQEGEILLVELLDIQKTLFSQLGLHFRILDMPTAELGAPANRKYDMEAWMPAKQMWGEISSASNCTDYQSRRLNIKYETSAGYLKHCTTVNGTACAVPRMIIAICENFQQKDGSIEVPDVLRQYMDNLKVIKDDNNTHNKSIFKSPS